MGKYIIPFELFEDVTSGSIGSVDSGCSNAVVSPLPGATSLSVAGYLPAIPHGKGDNNILQKISVGKKKKKSKKKNTVSNTDVSDTMNVLNFDEFANSAYGQMFIGESKWFDDYDMDKYTIKSYWQMIKKEYDLSDDEIKVFHLWKTNNYSNIKNDEEVGELFKKALQKLPKYKGKAYRMSLPNRWLNKKEGDVVEYPSFLSVSKTLEALDNVYDNLYCDLVYDLDVDEDEYLLNIIEINDVEGYDFSFINKNEEEVILYKPKFKIMSIDGNRINVKMI